MWVPSFIYLQFLLKKHWKQRNLLLHGKGRLTAEETGLLQGWMLCKLRFLVPWGGQKEHQR